MPPTNVENYRYTGAEFQVHVTGEGATHTYTFALSFDGETCYPVRMAQQGETYRTGVDEIPDAVLDEVETTVGLEVTER